MARILMVLSGSDHWTLSDGTRHPTGYWAEEFAVPHRTFRKAGLDVQISTPGGVRPTVDQVSLSPDRAGGEERAAELRSYLESIDDELAHPLPLEDAAGRSGDYDAVFIPGGHAPMEDLPTNAALGSVLADLWNSHRLVAAICHGPAGLLAGNREDGSWLFAGSRLTAFTDEEERQAGLADRAPWLLEDRLRERGAIFEAGPPWQPYVVVDGDLLTGQNPASSEDAAKRAVEMLGALQR
ncbi:type 1 glutamine amidotransferase domain-containing protein [Pseudonocardia bannensis]|uniref:Type 1 glutamine amidotransferase domain-containing protein n=1 Tax=Pseudonocardia bannensis TaxID=630973 RepID=A0A848DIB3_9PSEU|nr:type 1 glutamine amidotransferase domain-containing protein [Pseudonocardia bannensis]NMH92289.1 type 1 glutamine amidotransferase domain-containing protein [Pseudonocardia bannensis]